MLSFLLLKPYNKRKKKREIAYPQVKNVRDEERFMMLISTGMAFNWRGISLTSGKYCIRKCTTTCLTEVKSLKMKWPNFKLTTNRTKTTDTIQKCKRSTNNNWLCLKLVKMKEKQRKPIKDVSRSVRWSTEKSWRNTLSKRIYNKYDAAKRRKSKPSDPPHPSDGSRRRSALYVSLNLASLLLPEERR